MILKIPKQNLCNIIMTDEPAHTTLKQGMVPGLLLSSDYAPQLSITKVAIMFCF